MSTAAVVGFAGMLTLVIAYAICGTLLIIGNPLIAVVSLAAGYGVAVVSVILASRLDESVAASPKRVYPPDKRRFSVGVALNVVGALILLIGGSDSFEARNDLYAVLVGCSIVMALEGVYLVVTSRPQFSLRQGR